MVFCVFLFKSNFFKILIILLAELPSPYGFFIFDIFFSKVELKALLIALKISFDEFFTDMTFFGFKIQRVPVHVYFLCGCFLLRSRSPLKVGTNIHGSGTYF